jgi:arylsulfatase A-like enzyme
MLFATVASLATAPSPPPNIVIMLADDMGWGDWSRTGALAKTPHLEAMSHSADAVWFQRAYSGNPICSPTRASVLTGRTPARTCIYAVEQHILCREGAACCTRGEVGLANLTRDAGYLSGFYGKWHLGSLSDRGVGSPDCYEKPVNENCQLGYWQKETAGGVGCCFGVDGPKLQVSPPHHFGFDEFVATPECAASATSNFGCLFFPSPYNSSACELGHYAATQGVPYNECMQYYRRRKTGRPQQPRGAADDRVGRR